MTTGCRRLALLALTLGGLACHPEFLTAPEGEGAVGKFDKVWQDYDQHYVYFGLNRIDWGTIGQRYRSRAQASASDRELATIIGAMIGELKDYHAELTTPFGIFGPPPIPYAHNFSPALLREHYFAVPAQRSATGHVEFTRLADGTGYLYLGTFGGAGWAQEFGTALNALGDIPALIIDIRNNGGGDENIAQDIAARLYDKSRVYRRMMFKRAPAHSAMGPLQAVELKPHGPRFDKPVALITNRFNGSAAEEFTLMLRILPTVVTVGDTTLGLGSNPLTVRLSNGWSYRIPQSIQLTPSGMAYQSRGLPPSVPVAWVDADTAAGRDPYIEAALRELKRRTGR